MASVKGGYFGRRRPARWGALAAAGLLLLASGVGAAAFLSARQRFLADFNEGVRSYLDGRLPEARERLSRALGRRPGNQDVRRMLAKVLVADGLARYGRRDYAEALDALSRAAELFPRGSENSNALEALVMKVSQSAATGASAWNLPDALYAGLSAETGGGGASDVSRALAGLRAEQERALRLLSSAQERAMDGLRQEQRSFRRLVAAAFLLLVLFLAGFLSLLVLAFRRLFGPRGVVVQLLESQTQALLGAAGLGFLRESSERPALATLTNEFKAIEAIETDLVVSPGPGAGERLKPFLEDDDPWVRARAAKAMHRTDPSAAMSVLKGLVRDPARPMRLGGLWVLGEIATEEALDLLIPLAGDADKEVQQAALRCLIQLKGRAPSPAALARVEKALDEARRRSDWVI